MYIFLVFNEIRETERTIGRNRRISSEEICEFVEIQSFFNYLVVDGTVRRRNIGYDTSALRADSEPEFVEWTAEVAMELLTFQPQLPPREQLPGAKQYSQSQLLVGSRRQNHRRMASLRVTVTTRNVTLVSPWTGLFTYIFNILRILHFINFLERKYTLIGYRIKIWDVYAIWNYFAIFFNIIFTFIIILTRIKFWLVIHSSRTLLWFILFFFIEFDLKGVKRNE